MKKANYNFAEGKRKINKTNAIAHAQLIKLLMEGVHTCKQLAELSGLHYATVLQYCRELHEINALHICMWEKDSRGRDLIKIYKLGEGKDEKRRSMKPAERQAKYREKIKQMRIQKVMAGEAEFVARPNGRILYREIK
jgi:hypothetical protein